MFASMPVARTCDCAFQTSENQAYVVYDMKYPKHLLRSSLKAAIVIRNIFLLSHAVA